MCDMYTACVAVCAFPFVCETKGQCYSRQAGNENVITERRLLLKCSLH